jgi:DNA primase
LKESLLGVFDYCPKSLVTAGFDKRLLKSMDIGFDKDAMRITFPIRDLEGNLVGITGRTVVDEYPRYKVYKSKDLLRFAPDDAEAIAGYNRYDIKNHDYLWNAHNVYPQAYFGDLGTIVLVEGYKACLWLLQHGIDNAIALQGSRMTRTQELILERLSVTVVLFLDNNKAGKEGTFDTGQRLRRRGLETLVVEYPGFCEEQAQPDDLSPPEIMTALEGAEDWHFWRQRHGF